MRKSASRLPLLLYFKRVRAAFAAAVGSCFSCMLLLTGVVHGLDPNQRLTQYMHSVWRAQDGAPAGMSVITQTADGFLWFSSYSHDTYRFDGVHFLPEPLPAHAGSFSRVLNVYGDRGGGLWVLGEHDILYLKNKEVSSHFKLEGPRGPRNVSEAPDGSLWVLQAGYNIDSPLCHVAQGGLKCFGESDGITISTGGYALLPDGKGGFWLGGQRAVAHWHNGISETYAIEALKANTDDGVGAMAFDSDGALWVGLLVSGPGLGLGKLTNGVFRSFVTPGFDGSKLKVQILTFDRDGSLWVGTVGNGIFRIRGNSVEHFGRAEGLSGDTVWDLFEDREGILWVTTTDGIDNFVDPRVTTFSGREGLGPDSAMGVLASKDGTIWVANGASFDHIEKTGTVASIRREKGLPGDQVSSMLEDRAGNLWVGVYDGLYVFENGSFRRIPEPDHHACGLMTSITQDRDGDIWAECVGKTRRLLRIRDFQAREEFPSSQVPGGRLAADPHGGIWIGTRNRNIALFRDGIVKNSQINSDADLPTNALVVQEDGSVLAAFEDGLVGLRSGKAQRMTTKNGLPCNAIYSMIEDKDKRWWFDTDCGIIELPDSELERWWANPEIVLKTRLYDAFDGARPGGYAFNPAALSPDGRVWFANGSVVQMVDPFRLLQKMQTAETYINSVMVDRKEFAATNDLKIPPHPRDLQIDYTSPSFLIPQKVKFRYRLDGYERDWHEAGTRRQAFYTDLPPGKYSFRVIACNSDGVWNDTPARLDFSVTPAYYQTNWFRALCAVFLMALLWAAYQFRVRQLHHQFEMTLDARVGERTRIARELHDTLLQSAHGLLLRFQTVSQLLPGRPMEAKGKLDTAIEQTAEFITEARDEVQGLRDSTLQGNDLALAISTLGEELAADSSNHRPEFRVAVEGESRDLHPILRDETYKIAAEAMRNAFRHADARRVEVEIRYDNEQFRLRVRDDGKGIDPAVLSRQGSEGHYGLPGMRERATIMGAKLTVWSEVDAGTEVELRVPASTAYATSRRRSWFSRTLPRKHEVGDRS